MRGGGEVQLMNGQTSRTREQGQTPDRDTVASDPLCDAQAAPNGRNVNTGW